MQRRSVAAQSDQDLSFHKDVSEPVSSDPGFYELGIPNFLVFFCKPSSHIRLEI